MKLCRTARIPPFLAQHRPDIDLGLAQLHGRPARARYLGALLPARADGPAWPYTRVPLTLEASATLESLVVAERGQPTCADRRGHKRYLLLAAALLAVTECPTATTHVLRRAHLDADGNLLAPTGAPLSAAEPGRDPVPDVLELPAGAALWAHLPPDCDEPAARALLERTRAACYAEPDPNRRANLSRACQALEAAHGLFRPIRGPGMPEEAQDDAERAEGPDTVSLTVSMAGINEPFTGF